MHSRMVQRIRRRYAEQMHVLADGPPLRAGMQAAFSALQATGLDTSAALRVLRQLVIERLAVLDCEQQAPLAVVIQAMTELAELVLDVAVQETDAQLDALYGPPLAPDGSRARLWVVGMGKLGARELNVSSDIDLIYVYDHDGETAGRADGRGQISNHEYFAHQVRTIFGLIGDVTEHGFVFRVDLALRPNGNSGPAAVSLGALEDYFQAQGREWERFAWLKSRVVAPQHCIGACRTWGVDSENRPQRGQFLPDLQAHSPAMGQEDGEKWTAAVDLQPTTPKSDRLPGTGLALALRGVVLPFVFRRYLDYGVFDALRVLHRQIREHAAKRCAGHPERANDVKMSRGGIREIEFTVQLLQVVRGGQFPELRTRRTVDALQRLAKANLMPQDTADALTRAYDFLRRVEHRIQYLDDQQTHVLPTRDDDLDWVAHTMAFGRAADLLAELDAHRELVAGEFDRLLGDKDDCKTCGPAGGAANFRATGGEQDPDVLEQLSKQWPEQFRDRLALWRQHPRILALRDDSRARLMRLVQRTAVWLQEGAVTEEAAIRVIDWIEPLLRRESYLALLLERPAVHERLLRLLGAAKWPARYLLQHPGVIDELASNMMLHERFDATVFTRELHERLASFKRTGEDDEESCLNLLRRAHHAEVFRTLARDVEGVLTVEQVADDLSALAETVLRVTAQWCWQRLKTRHREAPQFAIIAYGKLGGKELGYGSDLDIVFVYEDEHERAPEVYAAFVRKLINWLTVKTGEGDLYEIDTALRPNGNSGLLVTSFAAYANYQQQRGSNTAWTWEHQAMTRARFVLGDELLRQRFEAIRRSVIMAPRDVAALQHEIVAMREKVRAAHPARNTRILSTGTATGAVAVGPVSATPQAETFDVKHTSGGMVDAEFAVQFLVLTASAQHPELADNVGNIALLQRAEQAGLLPAGVGQGAARAYRELRRFQHNARLNEEPTQVSPLVLMHEREAIQRLWVATFDSAGRGARGTGT